MAAQAARVTTAATTTSASANAERIAQTAQAAAATLTNQFQLIDARLLSLLLRMMLQIEKVKRPTQAMLVPYRQKMHALIATLQSQCATQCFDAVVSAYNAGVKQAQIDLALAGLRTPNIAATSLQKLHQRSMTLLADTATTRFDEVIGLLTKNSNAMFKSLQLDIIAKQIKGIDPIRQLANQLYTNLMNKGITAFKDRGGKRWELKSYAEMAARTITMDAQNKGQWNEYAAFGADLVQISSHTGACPKCEPFQGAVLSITGMTPGHTTVLEATERGLWHPNCRHTTSLWIEGV